MSKKNRRIIAKAVSVPDEQFFYTDYNQQYEQEEIENPYRIKISLRGNRAIRAFFGVGTLRELIEKMEREEMRNKVNEIINQHAIQ